MVSPIPYDTRPGWWFIVIPRVALPLVGAGCALALLLIGYRAVLFQDGQFAYRDAGHFYYPLYLRVQQEWQAGRWPLWDPWQNGGQPLLGNPVAAVLYPGKVIYAVLPYAWAVRVYAIAHTVLAYLGVVALSRSLGVSWAGAGIGGLCYAFGAPVLFQYDNVVYLVGAAWLPWGLRAAERLVRLRNRSGLAELSAVLAMEVLGGDPEAAYLTVVCGAGHAALLTARRHHAPRNLGRALTATGLGAWVVATLTIAYLRPSIPGWPGTIQGLAWLGWAAALGGVLWRWWRGATGELGPRLAGLAGASALAASIAGAQLVPAAEFAARSSRTGENKGQSTLTLFSVEPYRLAECLWPGIFGSSYPENRSWADALPPANDREMWEPSLYLGSLALVLSLGAAGFRTSPPWRSWLTAVALAGLVLGFGRFGSPLWWARWVPGAAQVLGPHDPIGGLPREDAFLEDAAGSPYSLFVFLLPGFGLFRYPAKLLTLTCAAVAVLSGSGWDDVTAGRTKRSGRVGMLALAASAAGLAAALALRSRAVSWLSSGAAAPNPYTGPADFPSVWAGTQLALLHGVVASAAGLALIAWGRRSPRRAGAAVLIVLTVDLAIANARLVWTVPQSAFDATPELARRIEAAERDDPSPGPFRIHRMPLPSLDRFARSRSSWRLTELLDRERDTLGPLYGLPLGIEYCATTGALELDEVRNFYRAQVLPAPGDAARALGIEPGGPVFYYPRRSYDLWGARYFILPVRPGSWHNRNRGYASFISDTEVIFPRVDRLGGPAGMEKWAVEQDWQLVRNKSAFPRAWVVHFARILPTANDPEPKREVMRQIVYQGDAIWSEPGRRVFDPRVLAWIETDDRAALHDALSRTAVEPGESVTVTRYEPQRVELKARLNQPGLVILADTFYPGWRLTVDGRPAQILRANRLMRGATVTAGEHALSYVYDPWSFRIGLALTTLGSLAFLLLAAPRRTASN